MDLKKIIRGEWIGKTINIVQSKNNSLKGIKGKIIDETKQSFILEEKKNKRKRVLKNNIIFETKYQGKTIKVKGKMVVGRPEDRIKLKVRL